ncbi:hypothetical protein TNCV_2214381 [Trichonephila clavipes]|nr:hypothetical protein TNCV_2214381 [Trichonephila clavipes]
MHRNVLMFANLHLNLCEYGSLRGNRYSEGDPRVTRTPKMVLEFLRTVSKTFRFQAGNKMCWILLPVGMRACPHYDYHLVMIHIYTNCDAN